MVARAGRYYGADFKGARGVTQRDQTPPHHFKYGGGCGGAVLGGGDGGGI